MQAAQDLPKCETVQPVKEYRAELSPLGTIPTTQWEGKTVDAIWAIQQKLAMLLPENGLAVVNNIIIKWEKAQSSQHNCNNKQYTLKFNLLQSQQKKLQKTPEMASRDLLLSDSTVVNFKLLWYRNSS